MLAIYTIAAFSQVTLGDGDASQDIPVDPFYGYSYSQTIYTSSQIAASGEITAISYYVDPGTTIGSSDDWKIFLAHTSLTQLTGWILDSLLTEVYAG